MQRYRVALTQFLLGTLLILPLLALIHDTIHIAKASIDETIKVMSPAELREKPVEINNTTTITPTNCRYGVASWSNNDYDFLQDLGVGWALNFSVNFGSTLPDGVEYTPMVRLKQVITDGVRYPEYYLDTPPLTDDPDGLGPIITGNPGKLWIVGNEVDRVYWQDDIMPDIYAIAYHDVYHFIKARDPSAQIAISGLVEVTPGRLQYLDIVWDSYLEKYGTPMPMDVWNMHIYILPEKRQDGTGASAAIALGTDPSLAILESGNDPNLCSLDDVYCYAEHDDMNIFADQVVAMRQWMKAHGQQNIPLILSEYSLLYPYDQEGDDDPTTCYLKDEFGNCFTPERVRQFMITSFNYLESATDTNIGFRADNYRLVQQWLWFAVNSGTQFSPNKLLEDGYTLTDYTPTLMGETFQTEVNAKRPFNSNAFINQVRYPTAKTISPSGTVSVTIAATVYNNGDTPMTTPITVTFYADEAKTHQIGEAILPAGLAGCARYANIAQVIWNGLGSGLHPYWAEVDGGNTVEGFVLINPEQFFLPITIR